MPRAPIVPGPVAEGTVVVERATSSINGVPTSVVVSAFRELVETYHRERCNGTSWQTCKNEACQKVQAVLK